MTDPTSGFPGDGAQPPAGAPLPPYAPPMQDQPGYAPPVAPPPGAYAVPVGGYTAPLGAYAPPPPRQPASRTLGALSLIAGLIVLVVVPVIVGILAFQIGLEAPVDGVLTVDGDFDPTVLAPVRGLVLACEILFWLSTALGIFAVVVGIVAITTRRGRGLGITGLILALLGPVAFFTLLGILWAVGTAAAFSSMYY